MKRRECLTILGAVIAGPLLPYSSTARTSGSPWIHLLTSWDLTPIPLPHPYNKWHPNVVEFDGSIDHLEHPDISGCADSRTVISIWFNDGEHFVLDTVEGRRAALYAAGRES